MNKSFDTVTAFITKWKDEMEVRDRVNELERMFHAMQQPK